MMMIVKMMKIKIKKEHGKMAFVVLGFCVMVAKSCVTNHRTERQRRYACMDQAISKSVSHHNPWYMPPI